jgi:hypothetical protein
MNTTIRADADESPAELNARQRKRRLATCLHFTGIQHHRCKAGVCYSDVRGSAPAPYSRSCIRDEHWVAGGSPPCALYEASSEAVIDAEDTEIHRAFALIAKGLSQCCEAPLSTRQVIERGQHEGNGPRFCSKCGQVSFWACGRPSGDNHYE